ncbi:Glyoxalase-like domain protein [Aquimixticola soesokkakensis]|uniref:Bleomycin resistance protein n=1 Tax=Aquimixticola soesokkakensis TaxID=1519096 RepID=A0A1Y5TC13_9RHOB|nr:VOC family protein [Aquimixticola soesokkakensis]SLN60304.1 Glyoxalase-like domain protein [Aquimixticola soesokkakensis]
MSAPDLSVLPVLRSPDLDGTQAFYETQLGFVPERVTPDYLILRRSGIELHFCPPDVRDGRATESSCYIRGGGIDALYDEFTARGVAGLRPFVHRPWGMFEFYLSDPWGVLLKFGRSDREGGAPQSLRG